jgi:hypothetical protein
VEGLPLKEEKKMVGHDAKEEFCAVLETGMTKECSTPFMIVKLQ